MSSVTMKKSISEVRNRAQSIKKVDTEASPNEHRIKGRSSLNSIPLPKMEQIYTAALTRPESPKDDKKDPIKTECEQLRNELCSAYKFVVNYGVFEPNFEWLPNEVISDLFQSFHCKLCCT